MARHSHRERMATRQQNRSGWFGWALENVWLLRMLDAVRQSFLFGPLVMAMLGVMLASLTLWLDDYFLTSLTVLFPAPSADTARAVSSTLAGSMMAVVGTTFTVTMAVLTLASGQFGPRLLRQFLSDGVAQFTLGSFMATFTFHLASLSMSELGAEDTGPRLTFAIGLLIAFMALIALIVFIQHVALGVQVDNLVDGIGVDFTERVAAIRGREHVDPPDLATVPHSVEGGTPGYLQAVDLGALVKVAAKHELYVVVHRRPGTHLLAHESLFLVSQDVDDTVRGELVDCIAIGPYRSITQDLEFALDQLAEIAVRALSPGVNDPFTAERCIDRLTECLTTFIQTAPIPTAVGHGDDAVRVWMRWPTIDELLDSALNKLRQAAARDLSAALRLIDACRRLSAVATDSRTRQLCLGHAERVFRSADGDHLERLDREELVHRLDRCRTVSKEAV